MDKEYAKFLLEDVRKSYDLGAESFSLARKQNWEQMAFLFKNIKKDEKVLDIGCGNGRLFEIFKSKNAEYTGIDNSEKLVNIAKNKYREADFKMGSGVNLPFKDEEFDKVYSISVLHHIPSEEFRQQFLEEARRVLKKKERLTITVWDIWKRKNIRKIIFKFSILRIFKKSKLDLFDIMKPWHGGKEYYFHCFTMFELKKLVKNSGFKIIKSGRFFVKDKTFSNLFIIAEKI